MLQHIFDLGLLKAVSSSIGFLLDQTDPNLTKQALIEIRLELSEPDVIFRPPIDSNLVGNFSDQIEGYVEDVYQMCALIPRIAAHKATQVNKGTPGDDTPLDTPDKSYADEVPPDTFDDKNHSVLALKERHYKRVLQEERHGMWIVCASDLKQGFNLDTLCGIYLQYCFFISGGRTSDGNLQRRYFKPSRVGADERKFDETSHKGYPSSKGTTEGVYEASKCLDRE